MALRPAGPVWLKSFKFFPEVADSPAPEERGKHIKGWERKHIPGFYVSHQFRKGASKNAANAQDSAVDQRLAGAIYIGNELLWLWQPKPKKCRKQLNGHLSFQTTITNRLESTFPPHLCKKIKFVPDSRQPFENDRIFNLAVGLACQSVHMWSHRGRRKTCRLCERRPFLSPTLSFVVCMESEHLDESRFQWGRGEEIYTTRCTITTRWFL